MNLNGKKEKRQNKFISTMEKANSGPTPDTFQAPVTTNLQTCNTNKSRWKMLTDFKLS